MMKRQRNTLITLMMLITLVLGACGKTTVSANLDDYPIAVQDGIVSVEYFEQLSKIYKESIPQIEAVREILEVQQKNNKIIYDEDYSSGFISLLEKFDELLSSYVTPPATEADEEIHFQLNKVIVFQSKLNKLELDYLDKQEAVSNMEILVATSMMKNMVEDLDDVVNKYELIE